MLGPYNLFDDIFDAHQQPNTFLGLVNGRDTAEKASLLEYRNIRHARCKFGSNVNLEAQIIQTLTMYLKASNI